MGLVLAASVLASTAPGRAFADRASERNAWPFPGFDDAAIRDYIDERVSSFAINLFIGRAILIVDGVERPIQIPLDWIEPRHLDVMPILPPRRSRERALRARAPWEPECAKRGITPVLFYRDAHGLIWPTVISPETAPRIMSVYARALAAARGEE